MLLIGAAQILWLPAVSPKFLLIVGLIFTVAALLIKKHPIYSWLAFFMFGLFYASWHCQTHLNNQLTEPTNKKMTILIDSLPKTSEHKISFIGRDINDSKKYLFNWYFEGSNSTVIDPGNVYTLEARFKPPHGLANGVGFDIEKWLFRQSIVATANITKINKSNQNYWTFKGMLNQWRLEYSNKINQHFKSPQVNALLHALSIGDKSHFEKQQLNIFQKTGTAHLIAISGLHIGMVAFLGWTLGAILFYLLPTERFNKVFLQVLLGLLLAVFYAGLAGLAVSTQRAIIMLSIFGIYKLLRQNSYAWDVWSLSMIVVLILDPLNVLDTGFWLSFSAVGILILSFTGIQSKPNKVLNLFKIQGVLLLGMLPLSLLVFSKVNLASPVINFILIPVMSFLLVPLLLLLMIVAQITAALPQILVEVINSLSTYFIVVLNWFGQVDVMTFDFYFSYWWQILLVILGTGILILPPAVPGRYLGIIFVILATFNRQEKIPKDHFKANFLDVGQGLSVLIRTQNHNLIYDVGAAYDSGFNMVDAALVPLLKKLQIRHLDALVLSHRDNDHSGASKYLFNHQEVIQTWGTEATHKACVTGNQWQWDGVTFQFISPYNLTPYLHNNSSCVLKISNQHTSILLTGDIESAVEYRLTQNNSAAIKADVLLIPHHGSKTSSTSNFIATVDPKWAINSSAKYNQFNHPADEVMKRYQDNNINIYDTQSAGLISLTSFPKLKIDTYRSKNPRIWRTKKPE